MMNRSGLRLAWLAVAGFLMILVFPALAVAQAGSLAGSVVDGDGNAVAGVSITVTPEASLSSRPRQLTTNDKGEFVIAGLTPGRYELMYAKEGYESASQEVQVRIAQRNRLGEIVLPKLPEDHVDPEAQKFFDAGVAATDAGDYQKAVDSFVTVLGMAPNVPEVHYNLGLSYEKLGNMEKAVEHYERALELRPSYHGPMIPLSDYYTAQRDWSRAAEYLKRATELKPDDLASHYNLGAVTMNSGDMDTARASFEKVLELDPTQAGAHYQLGMIAVSQAKNDEAILHLEKYVELDPDGAQAATAKGIIDTLKAQQ